MTEDDLRCPSCDEPVGAADRFCEQCGERLLVRRTPVGGPAGPIAGAGRRCTACGAEEIDAEGFCERCGRAQPAGRDRMEYDLGLVAGVSDRGKARARNEDSMAFALVGRPTTPRGVVAVVCDGVASSERAEHASQAAADAATDTLVDAVLDGADLELATTHAVAAAVAAVGELAGPAAPGASPSSTFVSAVVTPTAVIVGWVGDSRAYWLSRTPPDASPNASRNGGPTPSRRLTTDDTVAAELIAEGMAEEDARRVYHAHALSRWIGADAGEVHPHVVTLRPTGPGVIVLCSDGLWNYLPEAEALVAGLPAAPGTVEPLRAATALTSAALERGGHDNITVVVVPFPPTAKSEVPIGTGSK